MRSADLESFLGFGRDGGGAGTSNFWLALLR